jgi:hypothetical protein
MQALQRPAPGSARAYRSGSRAPAVVVRAQAQQQQQQRRGAGAGARAAAGAALAAAAALAAPAAHAAAEVSQLAEVDVSLALGGGAAVAGLGALLVATDPQKRCGGCGGVCGGGGAKRGARACFGAAQRPRRRAHWRPLGPSIAPPAARPRCARATQLAPAPPPTNRRPPAP